MNRSILVPTDVQTIQRTCLSLVGERGGMVTSQTQNGITALFTKKPSIIITLILFIFGFLPGLIYYWFAGRNYQLVVQFHEVPQGGTQLSVTAGGGRAKKVADALIKALGTGASQVGAMPQVAQVGYPAPGQSAGPALPPPPPPMAPRPVGPSVPPPPMTVPVATPAASSGSTFCTGCGKPIVADERFCTSCGTPARSLSAESSPEPRPAAVPAVAPAPTVPPAPPAAQAPPVVVAPKPPLPGYSLNTVAAPVTTAAVVAAASQATGPLPDLSEGNDGLTVVAEDELVVPEPVFEPWVESADAAATVIDEPEPEPEPSPVLNAELISETGAPIALTFFAEDQQLTVGRDSAQADFAIADPRASRVHFGIASRGGVGFLEDLMSSNGTFVNGERVGTPRALQHGDRIALGRTELTYLVRA